MHSLKTTCAGQIFALAKPHDAAGKRTRNRIPKEERKTLVQSFIKKHQRLNNGSFPSLSLTHKEVGGSFYTIREIVREIIQENRVLGTSDLLLDGKADDHLQDQALLRATVLMDPVPPLSLSPDGLHSPLDQSHYISSGPGETKSSVNGESINGSKVGLEDRGSDLLKCREVNGYQLSQGDVEHESVGSIDISETQFAASCGEENDTKHVAGLHDSFDVKPQDKELEVDNKDGGFEEMPFTESGGKNPLNNDESVNNDEAVMTRMVDTKKNTLATIDLPAETVVESHPVTSATSTMDVRPSELAKVCEAKVENDSNTETSVDLGEISSPISAVSEEQGTEVIVGQMPNRISVAVEKKVEEKAVNPASIGAVVGNNHEIKEISNGSLKTDQTMPTFDTESGSCKNDTARSEVTSVEKATVEKGRVDASDRSSSQKANVATLNRIKLQSWKGQPNVVGQETNPLLAVLKSFLTAFVKFWSE